MPKRPAPLYQLLYYTKPGATHGEGGHRGHVFELSDADPWILQWSGVVEDAERAAVESARLFGSAIRTRRALLRADPFK